MKTKSTKLFGIMVISSLLIISTSIPVFAQSPTFNQFELDIQNGIYTDCGDFTVIENSHLTFSSTLFFDSSGAWTRKQVQFTYDGTLTNSVTGKSVVDRPDHQTYVFTPDGSLTVHGLILSINIPGVGL